MNENYLNELNEAQRAAVEATEGPVMIVAGAGSGKTRVLTYRIAHLIKKGVDPFNILSLTFTNKAAREMKDRIGKIVSFNEARNLSMGTFHSVFARILRAEAERLGYPTNFTIYDTDDSKSLIKTILKEFNLDEKVYKPALVLGRISSAKNNLIGAAQYMQNPEAVSEDRQSGKPELGKIYDAYQKRCFKAGAMDFDDLLFNMNILLRDHPKRLDFYQDKFRYILVDEYQDTNFSQYVIVKQLAARFQNICVVGDDAQSIYGFRGANIQNILSFERDYPDLKTYKLEQNYRSTKHIVNAANSVIAQNKDQIQKVVWTANEEGQRIKVISATSSHPSIPADSVEANEVARAILDIQANHQAKNSSFAILYRANSLSRAMEEALRKKNIPYRIYGGLSFYQRKSVKDLLAYFRLALNPHDEEAFRRIINYPARGIGDTTLDKITIASRDNEVSMWTVCENLGDFKLSISSGTAVKISEFVTMVQGFQVRVSGESAYTLGKHIATTSGMLRDLYNDKTPEGVSHYENVEELLNGLKEFSDGDAAQAIELFENDPDLARIEAKEQAPEGETDLGPLRTLDQYMQDIALLTDADKKETEEDRNKVALMTIHASKGLEFPYVFVVGLEENLFPSALSINSRPELEEERRLFYVALTRAEKQCTLSWAKTRYKWGNLISNERSRFLDEISEEYLELSENKIERKATFSEHRANESGGGGVIKKKTLIRATAINSAPAAIDNSHLKSLEVGQRVRHERFGDGMVQVLEGVFPNVKATVVFDGIGQKQLLLKFAKLELIQ